MANVYEYVMDTNDFFDTVLYCNEDTDDWEQFVKGVANYAATDASRGFTAFEDFVWNHGYADKIADVIYEAAKAFTNSQIEKTKSRFDLI